MMITGFGYTVSYRRYKFGPRLWGRAEAFHTSTVFIFHLGYGTFRIGRDV